MTIKWYCRFPQYTQDSGTIYSIEDGQIYYHHYGNKEKGLSGYNSKGLGKAAFLKGVIEPVKPMTLEWLIANQKYIPEYISQKTVTAILNSFLEEIQQHA